MSSQYRIANVKPWFLEKGNTRADSKRETPPFSAIAQTPAFFKVRQNPPEWNYQRLGTARHTLFASASAAVCQTSNHVYATTAP
jgi:hypothetical protein